MTSPYDADNVLYATLIETADQDIADCRAEVNALRCAFELTGHDADWTRYASARGELARLIRQVRGYESDQRVINAHLDAQKRQNVEASERQDGGAAA